MYLLTYLRTYLLSPWSRVLPEKLIGSQLVKNSLRSTEPEGSLPPFQMCAACPYTAQDQSSLCPRPRLCKLLQEKIHCLMIKFKGFVVY